MLPSRSTVRNAIWTTSIAFLLIADDVHADFTRVRYEYGAVQQVLEGLVAKVRQRHCRGLDGADLNRCYASMADYLLPYRGSDGKDGFEWIYDEFDDSAFGSEARRVQHIGASFIANDSVVIHFILERVQEGTGDALRIYGPVLRAYWQRLEAIDLGCEAVELTAPAKGWNSDPDPRTGESRAPVDTPRLWYDDTTAGIWELYLARQTVFPDD